MKNIFIQSLFFRNMLLTHSDLSNGFRVGYKKVRHRFVPWNEQRPSQL
jgi:hypothetical protein